VRRVALRTPTILSVLYHLPSEPKFQAL